MNSSYDFVIAGAGAAGLSLAVRMVLSGKFSDGKILIVDRDDKKKNDRTWCFWEKENSIFESIIYKKWGSAWFHGAGNSKLLELSPYTYNLVRGIDFYEHCFSILEDHPNLHFKMGTVTDLSFDDEKAWCRVDGQRIGAEYIFSSIYEKPRLRPGGHMLLQHFRGWRIKTQDPAFDPSQAVLMDFRMPQEKGTTFVYLLPFSETEALVEFTLFTESLLEKQDYEKGLSDYLEKYFPGIGFTIEEEEAGVIPMTDHRFPASEGRIIPIGTAGGQTKASTGYTFSFIQKHSEDIVDALLQTAKPYIKEKKGSRRFRFYDSTLLEILQYNKVPGHIVFEKLFLKNSPQKIFRFLDNQTSLPEEIGLLLSLPVVPFLKAGLKQL